MNKTNLQQAVVVAGGLGTRLMSINGPKPKVLTEINGKPLLEVQLIQLVSAGFYKVTYLLGSGSDQVIQFLKEKKKMFENDLVIEWILENEPLGTGGSVLSALEYLDETFLVIYGDIYINSNLAEISKNFVDSEADFACIVHPSSHIFDSDIIEIDNNNGIRRIHSKTRREIHRFRNLANSGVYFFKKKALVGEEIGACDLDKTILPNLISKEKKGIALRHKGIIRDIGTPERLREIQDLELTQDFHMLDRPALFLDRDGVINKFVGHVESPNQIEIDTSIGQLISSFNQALYWVFVVTNQPIVAHGKISMEILKSIHEHIEMELSNFGGYIDDFFVCPHHPDKGYPGEIDSLKIECECRKPKTGMIKTAMKKYNIDIENSLMIGDTWRDERFAQNAGLKFVLLEESTQVSKKSNEILSQVIPILKWWNNQ